MLRRLRFLRCDDAFLSHDLIWGKHRENNQHGILRIRSRDTAGTRAYASADDVLMLIDAGQDAGVRMKVLRLSLAGLLLTRMRINMDKMNRSYTRKVNSVDVKKSAKSSAIIRCFQEKMTR